MARRVSWVNNSSGHNGTYVYRAETLDPQNLPAPVATVDPVAQGETAEWIDDFTGYECYAVKDFDGQGVGSLSAEVCVTETVPPGVSVGDATNGGIYAGIDTIGGTDYHIISGVAASEAYGLKWKTSRTTTPGADSETDGLANTLAMEAAGLAAHPAGAHCLAYEGSGYTDWHMPARSQLTLIYNNLAGHAEFSTNVGSGHWTWASTEDAPAFPWQRRFSDGAESAGYYKDYMNRRTRPIRRVAV